MANPESIMADAAPSRTGCFEVRVSLTGMGPDDSLSIVLPPEFAGGTLFQLLAYTFPPGEEERRAVALMFDLRANPDLPEIYAVFLNAFDEWRNGRCALLFSASDGQDLDLAGLVSRLIEVPSAGALVPANENPLSPPFGNEEVRGFLRAGGEDISEGDRQSPYPRLAIQIEQQHWAIEYATRMGFWESKQELLEWLRLLTVLYFLDKHEVEIPAAPSSGSGPILMAAVGALQEKGLISCSLDSQRFDITEEGRGFISRLLTETESYIDLYDHFKDVEFDLDSDTIAFDTGRGVDLRVQVFLAEGLDPIRTVFLLRLYDGTLDDSISTWESFIDDESFFDSILEPAVNRCEVDETVIGQIVESGYGFLEEREERARELESQQEVIRGLRI